MEGTKFVITKEGYLGRPGLRIQAQATILQKEIITKTPISAVELAYAIPVLGQSLLVSEVASGTKKVIYTEEVAKKQLEKVIRNIF